MSFLVPVKEHPVGQEDEEKLLLAEVAVETRRWQAEHTLTYKVPLSLQDAVKVGSYVVVPLRNTYATGYVLNLSSDSVSFPTRDIICPLEDVYQLSPELIRLSEWISRYYMCSLPSALKLLLPPAFKRIVRVSYRAKKEGLASKEAEAEDAVLRFLEQRKRFVSLPRLRREFPKLSLGPLLQRLKSEGLVEERLSVSPRLTVSQPVAYYELTEEMTEADLLHLTKRAPRQARVVRALIALGGKASQEAIRRLLGRVPKDVFRALERKNILKVVTDFLKPPLPGDLRPRISASQIKLTRAQQTAIDLIESALEEGRHHAFLLKGVTASGKTEVYLRAIAKAREVGKGAILLVPEIALTPQSMGQLRERFASEAAVLHSRLTPRQRLEQWERILRGEARVVVGPRSALFAPVANLGLIVVDEAHETSYKSQSTPLYDARTAAAERAKLTNAVLIFGSATPSLELYHEAKRGHLTLLELPVRIDETPLPSVEVVDMRRESPEQKKLQLSDRLREAVNEALESGQQALLFLNRRGHSTFAMCYTCGEILKCPNCAVSLVLHRRDLSLRCHHCGYREEVPEVCPVCGEVSLQFSGTGTEKVEEKIAEQFPERRLMRIDRDTAFRRDALTQTLRRFAQGEGDILIGTQMIAKGLDFENVALVGVINADTALSLPDFRAAERTFQILTQVSGRAGRGSFPGTVIIQSYNPAHYSVVAAQNHDYQNFCELELRERRRLSYPPFVNLINLTVSHTNQQRARTECYELAKHVKNLAEQPGSDWDVLGPAPAPRYKLKKKYRWHILLKTKEIPEAVSKIQGLLEEQLARQRRMIDVDVDPVSVL